MDFDQFCKTVSEKKIVLKVNYQKVEQHHFLNNEALFQLPLISIIVLLMAKDRRKPLVSEIGQNVGECIENTLYGFKGSSQHIGWSANLRVRTVKAINFLEQANLIEIENRKSRVKITELGKKVIEEALKRDDELSYHLVNLTRSYRNNCVSKQLKMEL